MEHYGIKADRDKLIANKMGVSEIAKTIGADSLGYLSVEDVVKVAVGAKCDFCSGCFTGEYPLPEPESVPKSKFEQRITNRE